MLSNQCPSCGQKGTIDERQVCQGCGYLSGKEVAASKMPLKSAAVFFLAGVLATGMFLTISKPPVPAPPAPEPVPVVVSQNERPQLDVVFTIDTTGSMADEIDTVKSQVRKIMKKVQAGQPRPEVRFGLVLFRDRGDQYVTRKIALTKDLASIDLQVQQITADGGGDTPEAVSEALHVAVQEMDWNYDENTSRMIFLLGDAAPQKYQDGYDYRTELAVARQKGIKVSTWGCSGIADSGENEYREIARIGGGEFDFLTYSQEVVRDDGARVNVVFRGKKSYELSKDDDWKAGEKVVRAKGRSVKVVAPTAYGAPKFSKRYRSAPKAKLKNNLDRAISESMMREAETKGVRYK